MAVNENSQKKETVLGGYSTSFGRVRFGIIEDAESKPEAPTAKHRFIPVASLQDMPGLPHIGIDDQWYAIERIEPGASVESMMFPNEDKRPSYFDTILHAMESDTPTIVDPQP